MYISIDEDIFFQGEEVEKWNKWIEKNSQGLGIEFLGI